MEFLGHLLKLGRLESIDSVDARLAATWAQMFGVWLVPAFFLLCVAAIFFYVRFQTRARPGLRLLLAVSRALLLCLLLLFLADPILIVRLSHTPRPWFWVLFDGSDSMAIEDEYADADRQKLDAATGLVPVLASAQVQPPPGNSSATDSTKRPSRQEYVAAMLKKRDGNILRQLSEKYRLKAFQFERPDGAGELKTQADDELIDPAQWAEQLATIGKVTALGQA